MNNKKCKYLVRVCPKGIKCKLIHSGKFYFEFDINTHSKTEFTLWDDKEKKTGAQIFASNYCKGNFENCRLYKEEKK